MKYNVDQIAELFPDIRAIREESLRKKVATVWDEALTTGCGGKGWTFDEIRAILFTLLAGKIDMRFVEHLNSCVKQCIAIAKVLNEVFGGRVPVNTDHLIAGALLADVGKMLEFDKDAAGNVIKGPFGDMLRHPFSGVALCYKHGLPPEVISRCVSEAGVGFMWAPMHHPAMKHWAPIRAELGIRTIFNLLGPISNPAGVKRQVVGVFSWHWVEPIAHVLRNLGAEHVWVVHGHDGLDELTTTGATDVAEVRDGQVTVFEVTPADAGVAPAKLSDLKGGDDRANAAAIRDVLAGKKTPLRDIAVLNASAALIVAGKAANLLDCAALAAHSIESGAAKGVLDKLVAISNGRA